MPKARSAKTNWLAVLLVVFNGSAMADQSAADAAPAALEQRQKTGKERLSGKAADEQRVNDCKVPPEKRGAMKRPTACTRAKSAR